MSEGPPTDRATLQAAFDAAMSLLKGKQQTFVLEVLKGKNHTDAAIAAGWSERWGRKQGYRMSTNVDISRAIEAGRKLAAVDAVMDAQEVLQRLTRIGRGSLEDFLRTDREPVTVTWSLMQIPETENGEPDEAGALVRLAWQREVKPTDRVLKTETVMRSSERLDLTAANAAGKLGLIKKFTVDDKGKMTIELYSSFDAIVQIGKHHGLFIERLEHTGAGGAPLLPPIREVVVKRPDERTVDTDK